MLRVRDDWNMYFVKFFGVLSFLGFWEFLFRLLDVLGGFVVDLEELGSEGYLGG